MKAPATAQQASVADEDTGVVTALLLMLLASTPQSATSQRSAWSDHAHRLGQPSLGGSAWWISGLPQ